MGDSIKNSTHRLIDLNASALVGETVREGLGVVVLLEELCHCGLGFEVSNLLKTTPLSLCVLCLQLMEKM